MITGWLVKIVVGFGLAGFVVVEAGAPLVIRAQLDGVAHDAADSAARDLLDRNDAPRAQAVAQQVAAEEDAALKSFTIDQNGVHVTVEREAPSVLLKKVEPLQGWYDVEVSASASTMRR